MSSAGLSSAALRFEYRVSARVFGRRVLYCGLFMYSNLRQNPCRVSRRNWPSLVSEKSSSAVAAARLEPDDLWCCAMRRPRVGAGRRATRASLANLARAVWGAHSVPARSSLRALLSHIACTFGPKQCRRGPLGGTISHAETFSRFKSPPYVTP